MQAKWAAYYKVMDYLSMVGFNLLPVLLLLALNTAIVATLRRVLKADADKDAAAVHPPHHRSPPPFLPPASGVKAIECWRA